MLENARNRLVGLLRWSERHTRIDMVYFVSGSFWQTFGQALNALLALALILLFANFLPKEVYGTYRYLISLAGVLTVFTLTGMNQAVSQAVSVGQEGALRAAVRYQLKWNSILMVVFLTLGLYYLSRENFAYTGSLFILGISTPLIAALNTYGAYLSGKRHFQLNNILSVISTLIYTLGMAATIFVSGKVVVLVATYALTTLFANGLGYLYTVWKFRPPLEKSPETMRYGRHLTFIGLLDPIVTQLDAIILNHFWGAAPVAVYSIVSAIPNRAVPFVKSWVDVGFPKLATKTMEELHETFFRRIGQGLLLGSVIAIAYAAVAPTLFKYLLPQYLDAVFFTQILAANFVVAMPNRYVASILTAKKLSKHIFFNTSLQNMARLIAVLALGISGGVLGIVIARVFSTTFNLGTNIIVWLIARKSVQ